MDQMIGEDMKVPNAEEIGLAFFNAKPDIDITAVALVTCMFHDRKNTADMNIWYACGQWNDELAKQNAWTAPDL